ncbi:MAG: glycerate kinase type-2 family protein, partial [Thermoanaerobaculia bacterium]
MDAREILIQLYRAAVAAVDPAALVSESLGRRGAGVFVRSVSSRARREFVFAPSHVAVLAVGKAAVPMAAAAHMTLGSRIDEMLVVAPEDAPFRTLPPSTRTIAARHPLPDAGSLVAGEAALSLAGSLGRGDLFVVLLSGGGSSLLCAPAPGISLEDKSKTTALLLAAGAPITDVNAVRAALSRVKGGRLAAAAGAADVVTLVLSDLGDDGWYLVASGPTLGSPTRPSEARAVLDRYRIAALVPPSVRAHLTYGFEPAVARPGGPRWSVLLADVHTALEGARVEALRLGIEPRVVPELLCGEARVTGRRLAFAGATAGDLRRQRSTLAPRRHVTILGGETTVTLKGHGHGGRNREVALAAAREIAEAPGIAMLCAGTDGVDHEPDAAGAFVDGTTLARAAALGLDPSRALLDNDTGPFFRALGDAFSPGPTGTNVGDVAFVLGPPV